VLTKEAIDDGSAEQKAMSGGLARPERARLIIIIRGKVVRPAETTPGGGRISTASAAGSLQGGTGCTGVTWLDGTIWACLCAMRGRYIVSFIE